MNAPLDTSHLNRIRILSQGLVLSGCLNIVLVTCIVYWFVRERPPASYCELKPADKKELQAPIAMDKTLSDAVREYKEMPIEQLILKLSDTQLIESGYTERDLSLAALVAFHYFDLSKALIGLDPIKQERQIAYGVKSDGKRAEVTVYPELTPAQWEAIIEFANREKWPFTSKGLFLKVRKLKSQADQSLLDAFYLTPEFLSVETLFSRSTAPLEKEELLTFIRQGNWPMISNFSEQQRKAQDLTPARRQRLLLEYIERGSKAAAYILLKTDGAYAARKLDDSHLLAMLNLMNEKSDLAERFCLAVLTAPRGDAVWKAAASRLYQYAGEPLPEQIDQKAALSKFFPKTLLKNPLKPPKIAKADVLPIKANFAKIEPQTNKGSTVHVVQEGDSLWKISRRYKVDIEKLKSYNKLTSDFLKPGTSLKIP